MKNPIIENQGNGNYYIFLDYGTSNGVLHFSHELSVWVHNDDDGLTILHADEINSDGWVTLCPKGIENVYPGILKTIEEVIEDYEKTI